MRSVKAKALGIGRTLGLFGGGVRVVSSIYL